MNERETDLLSQLGEALATTSVTPTLEEVSAFRALVDSESRSLSAVADLRTRRRRGRVRRVTLAAAVAAVVVFGGGAVALATGGPFSGVARRAASSLGLPVDSPELSSAKNALAGLRAALAGHDVSRIGDARLEVDRRLAALSGDDATEVNHEARELLREADERLGSGHDAAEHPASGGHGGDGDRTSGDDRGSGRSSSGSGRGGDSSPKVGPSNPASGSPGSATTLPTAPSGGSGDGGGGDGGGSDGGSGLDGASGSGH